MSLSRIIHHSHSFTRLEIYHHIYFKITLISLLAHGPGELKRVSHPAVISSVSFHLDHLRTMAIN